jgi:glycosyltransferase involved in cell wall biosynthesis
MIQNKQVLIISPFEHWPLSQGSIVRTYFLVKHLAQSNKVFFAYRRSVNQVVYPFVEQSLDNHPNPFLQLFNPLFFFHLWRIASKNKVDILIVSHLWSSIIGILLKLFTGKPLWIDTHNVEYLRFQRAMRLIWPFVALLEFIAYRVADQLICVSEVDRAYLVNNLRLPEEKIYIAPNGADIQNLFDRKVNSLEVKRQLVNQPDKEMILFFGSLTHQANADAVDIILNIIAPRLSHMGVSGNIVIVGPGQESYLKACKAALPSNVLFAGFAKDITAVIKSADLIIVPLVSGSGTRLKILESVACGKRVISTSIGAEGLIHRVFEDRLLICDDWDTFVQQIQNKLSEPEKPFLPPKFAAIYDWDNIFATL